MDSAKFIIRVWTYSALEKFRYLTDLSPKFPRGQKVNLFLPTVVSLLLLLFSIGAIYLESKTCE